MILFRCDASDSIGSGHVMRCRTLARRLKEKNCDILFICRRQKGDMIGILKKEFKVQELTELSLLECDNLKGRAQYESWLGCSQKQDAKETIEAINEASIKYVEWLVIDHYGIDHYWEGLVKTALRKIKLLSVDDLADRKHKTDMLLDQNYFGIDTDERYMNLVQSTCHMMLGPKFALLGPEYAVLRQKVHERKDINSILIYFGGADNEDLAVHTLEAVSKITECNNKHIDVVIGHQSKNESRIRELSANNEKIKVHNMVPSLANLMSTADLAVSSGGVTMWEKACLRLPSLVITTDQNQEETTQAMHNSRKITFIGRSQDVSRKDIQDAIEDEIKKRQHKDPGYMLCDGDGTNRVVERMLNM